MTTGGRGRAVVLLAGILLSAALSLGAATQVMWASPPARREYSRRRSVVGADLEHRHGPGPRREVWDLYDVGGHKLYISCAGTGSPTVVHRRLGRPWLHAAPERPEDP